MKKLLLILCLSICIFAQGKTIQPPEGTIPIPDSTATVILNTLQQRENAKFVLQEMRRMSGKGNDCGLLIVAETEVREKSNAYDALFWKVRYDLKVPADFALDLEAKLFKPKATKPVP